MNHAQRSDEQRRREEADRAAIEALNRLQRDEAYTPPSVPSGPERHVFLEPEADESYPPLKPLVVLLDFIIAFVLTLVTLFPLMIIIFSARGFSADRISQEMALEQMMQTPSLFIISAVLQAFLFMLVVVVRVIWLNHRNWRWLGFRPGMFALRTLGWGAIGGLLFLAINVVLSLLAQQIGLEQPNQERALPLENASVLGIIIIGLGVVLLAPISEELFFRAYAQRVFMERFGAWPGILLGATLFTLPHLLTITQGYTVLLIAVFAGGVILGWTYWHTRQITSSIVAHMINNSFAFLGIIVAQRMEGLQ